MHSRSGGYQIHYPGEAAEYQSFIPSPLPPSPSLVLDDEMMNLLAQASTWLSKLESVSSLIPHMPLFISMYVRKEALMSSQIEGTQCTLDDILNPDLLEIKEVEEVINYVKAIEFAIKRMEEIPLCNRLIRETHAILLDGVRGENMTPGEFRISQNWIGGEGVPLKRALFVPPHPTEMLDALNELEAYLYDSDDLNVLIKIALIHYQFETIHPFLDGNGRIGRLLITLYLLQQKIITTPALYISYALKKNRTEYYDRLMLVRTKGEYEQWVKFFLRAIIESAKDSYEASLRLTSLQQHNRSLIENLGRPRFTALKLLSYIESHPIMTIATAANSLGLSYNTISTAVRHLVDLDILVQTSDDLRNRKFSYHEYLAILRDGT